MKYFLLLVVTWCVSCVGPYRQVDEVGGVGYDVLEDDSENYIIGYKGNAFTNRYLAYDLLKLKSADLALEKNMPFYRVIDLESGVDVTRIYTISSISGYNVQTFRFFNYKHAIKLSPYSSAYTVDARAQKDQIKKKWGFENDTININDLYRWGLSVDYLRGTVINFDDHPLFVARFNPSTSEDRFEGLSAKFRFDGATNVLVGLGFKHLDGKGSVTPDQATDAYKSEFNSSLNSFTIFKELSFGTRYSTTRFLVNVGIGYVNYSAKSKSELTHDNPDDGLKGNEKRIFELLGDSFEVESNQNGFAFNINSELQIKLSTNLRVQAVAGVDMSMMGEQEEVLLNHSSSADVSESSFKEIYHTSTKDKLFLPIFLFGGGLYWEF